MIRKAVGEDASRIAEILIFAKRTAYRTIFKNDKVSFGKMQVLPLALAYRDSPDLLADLFVYEDEFVKGVIRISIDGCTAEIRELYVDPFFKSRELAVN